MQYPSKLAHVIQPGDTLYRLARAYDTTIQSMRALNPGVNANNLRIGQTLHILPGSRYKSPEYVQPTLPTPPCAPPPAPAPSLPPLPAPEPLPEPIPMPAPLPEPLPLPEIAPLPAPYAIPTPSYTPAPSLAAAPDAVITPDLDFAESEYALSPAEAVLIREMQTAWLMQIFWTHLFAVSTADNLEDTDVLSERLLHSSDELTRLFSRYYGAKRGQEAGQLFTKQIMLARDYMQAVKAGDTPEVRRLSDAWYNSAALTAQYLASINPYYNESELCNMFYDVQDLDKEDISSRLEHDYKVSSDDLDRLVDEAEQIASYLATGIVRHLPNEF